MIIGAFALVIGLSLYTLLDAARTPAADARTLPKWLWIIIIIFFPVVGPVFWLFFGRARSAKSTAEQPPAADTGRGLKGRRGTVPPAPKAPDDDEEYLRWLKAKAERERHSREAESNNKQDSAHKDSEPKDPELKDPEDGTPNQGNGQN